MHIKVAVKAGLALGFATASLAAVCISPSVASATCHTWGYSVGKNGNSKDVQKPSSGDTCVDFNQYNSNANSFFQGWHSPTENNWIIGSAGCTPVGPDQQPVILQHPFDVGNWAHSQECGTIQPSSITTNIYW